MGLVWSVAWVSGYLTYNQIRSSRYKQIVKISQNVNFQETSGFLLLSRAAVCFPKRVFIACNETPDYQKSYGQTLIVGKFGVRVEDVGKRET